MDLQPIRSTTLGTMIAVSLTDGTPDGFPVSVIWRCPAAAPQVRTLTLRRLADSDTPAWFATRFAVGTRVVSELSSTNDTQQYHFMRVSPACRQVTRRRAITLHRSFVITRPSVEQIATFDTHAVFAGLRPAGRSLQSFVPGCIRHAVIIPYLCIDAEYVEIATRRIAYWSERPNQQRLAMEID
jgi:hypothetical protein